MSTFKKENLPKGEEKEVPRKKKHTIMIVDDEIEQLKSLKSLFAGDYEVITFQGGQEALEYIQKMGNPGSISLIISDQRMPNLTGVELFEHLLPVIPDAIRIILSAYSDKPDILASINRAKIYNYILKPFEPDDLKLRVERAIEIFEVRRERDVYQKELEEKNQELSIKNKELKELSLTDSLTGLRNRRYLDETLERDILRLDRDFEDWKKTNVSNEPPDTGHMFMMLDLDHFKSVNDKYGHLVGSETLKQFAVILRKTFRNYDILVRYGGEEFLVFCNFISRDEASDLAERMRKAVEDHSFEIENKEPLKITCSIGFASYPFLLNHPKEIDWEKVVAIADKALYGAKNSGRNACVGIMGTDKTNPENLMQRIDKDIEQMVQNGELSTYSTGGKPVKWHS